MINYLIKKIKGERRKKGKYTNNAIVEYKLVGNVSRKNKLVVIIDFIHY